MLLKFSKYLFTYSISSVIRRFIPFLLVPFFTKIFTPEEYGNIQIIILTGNLLTLISSFGLNQAIIRFFHDYKGKKRLEFISSLTFFQFFLSCISVIISVSIILMIKPVYYQLYIYNFLINAFIPLGMIGLNTLRLEFKSTAYAVINGIQILIFGGLSFYLCYVQRIGILGYILAIIISNIFFIMINLFMTRHYFTWKFNKNIIRESIHFSLPLIPTQFFQWAQLSIDRYLILTFFSMKFVGIYSVAFQFSFSVLSMLRTILQLVWSPYAFKNFKKKNMKHVFLFVFILVIFVFSLASIFITNFMGQIMKLIVAENFWGAGDLINLLVIPCMLYAFYYLSSMRIHFASKTIYVLWSYLISMLAYLAFFVVSFYLFKNIYIIPFILIFFYLLLFIIGDRWGKKFYGQIEFPFQFSILMILLVLGNGMINLFIPLDLIYRVILFFIFLLVMLSLSYLTIKQNKIDLKRLKF
jgi:O-antigen/teichoic acid export membrane protein